MFLKKELALYATGFFLGWLPSMSKVTFFVCFYFIFEILEFWRNGCFVVWGGLVLQAEERCLQFYDSKAKRIEFIISAAQ